MEIESRTNDHCLLEGNEKKKEQGKSLWSGEGMKYFYCAEKNGERYMQMMQRCE
jgi:hypothetical protein